ncbi:MAG: hypothetical protein KJ922_03620, partial [Nanoarchaeota archaeon]|nr:hypothetical protein [Nanoarchaeota archaeon]
STETKVLSISGSDLSEVDIPAGYHILVEPFKVSCTEGELYKMTVSVPDNYGNIEALTCKGGFCTPTQVAKVSTLVCGEEVKSTTREMDVIDPELLKIDVEERDITLSELETSLASGDINIQFHGEAFENLNVKLSRVKEDVAEAANTQLKIVGAPVELEFSGKASGNVTITLPYSDITNIEPDTLGIYVKTDGNWDHLGGITDAEKKVVTVTSDISEYLGDDNKAIFAVMGIICVYCYGSELESVYEPTFASRDAIVLIHGLGSSPETYKEIIDDIRVTEQPFKVYTFGYPTSHTINQTAVELADHLESRSSEFDNLYIVAHSMGGIITQKALYNSWIKNSEAIQYTFVNKTKRVVLVGVPNEGSPVADFYTKIYDILVNSQSDYPLFNMNSNLVKALAKRSVTPRVPGINYYVVAGTKNVAIGTGALAISTEDLFGEPSDGFVSTTSATNVGEEYLRDRCRNYWEIDTTHTGLLDDAAARTTIERIISEDIINRDPELVSILGHNKYFDLVIESCSPDDTYVVIGKELPKSAVVDLTGCLCGNGVCGEGEDQFNCAVDCVSLFGGKRFVVSLKVMAILAAFAALLLIGSIAFVEHVHHRKNWIYIKLYHYTSGILRLGNYIDLKIKGSATRMYRALRNIYVHLVSKRGVSLKQAYALYYDLRTNYRRLAELIIKWPLIKLNLLKFNRNYHIVRKLALAGRIAQAELAYAGLRDTYVRLSQLPLKDKKISHIFGKTEHSYHLVVQAYEKYYLKAPHAAFDSLAKEIYNNVKADDFAKAKSNYNKLLKLYHSISELAISKSQIESHYAQTQKVYEHIEDSYLHNIVSKKTAEFNSHIKEIKKALHRHDYASAKSAYKKLLVTYDWFNDNKHFDKSKKAYQDIKDNLKHYKERVKLEKFADALKQLNNAVRNNDIEGAKKAYAELVSKYKAFIDEKKGHELYGKVFAAYRKLYTRYVKMLYNQQLTKFNSCNNEIIELLRKHQIAKAKDAYRSLRQSYLSMIDLAVKDVESLTEKVSRIEHSIEKAALKYDLAKLGKEAEEINVVISQGKLTEAKRMYQKMMKDYKHLLSSKVSERMKRKAYEITDKIYLMLKK